MDEDKVSKHTSFALYEIISPSIDYDLGSLLMMSYPPSIIPFF
jgi:hypothetical protein